MRIYLLGILYLLALSACDDEASQSPAQSQLLQLDSVSKENVYPFTINVEDDAETVVHAGKLVLDAPAGKHGVLGVDEEGHFRFSDGTPVKFWGMNLVGAEAVPDESEGEILAARLAKLGVNLVRFHWLDYETIWNEEGDDLDETQLVRLGRFMEQLGKQGIYVNMNLLSGWKMNLHPDIADPTWPSRSRYIIFWDDRAQKLLAWYARELFTRIEVGGVQLGKHPILAQVETLNENVLANGWSRGYLRFQESDRNIHRYGMTDEQLKPLYQKWLAFLKTRLGYENDAELKEAWNGRMGEWESLEDNRVDLGDENAAQNWSLRRIKDTQQFLLETEFTWYQGFIQYLKDEGIACPISGSQFLGMGAPTLAARMTADYFNTHGYWNHHRKEEEYDLIPQLSLLEHADTLPIGDKPGGSPVLRFAPNRIGGKPFTVSEYNTAYPSLYGYELTPMLAAYASFQAWDGLDYFGFSHGGSGMHDRVPKAPLTMSGNVLDQVLSPVLSVAFLRGDFAAGKEVVRARHDPGTVVEDTMDILRHGRPQDFHYGQTGEDFIPAWTPFVRRVERVFDPTAESAPVPDPGIPGFYESSTGELLLDLRDPEKVYFRADSSRTQMIVGRKPRLQLSVLGVQSESDGAFVLTSYDGATLNESGRALLVSVGHQGATGGRSELEERGLRVFDYGEAPMLLAPMKVGIRIRSSTLSKARVYSLDPSGARISEVETRTEGDLLHFDLTGRYSPWFEIVVEGEKTAKSLGGR